MRAPIRPWLLGVTAVSCAAAVQVAGCGGSGSSTSQAGGTTSSTSGGGTTSSSTASTSGSTSGGGGTGGMTASSSSAGGAGGASSSSTGGSTTVSSSSTASSSSSSGPPPVGCGNGTLDPGEQCDDGNNLDLDGCDRNCNYEVVQRMSAIAISGNTGPSFCVHNGNQLGHGAITMTALMQLNPPLATDVGNGTVNVLTQVLNLSDLTGQSAMGFAIGVVDGSVDPAKGAWTQTAAPEDWWFLVDPTVVNMGMPTGQLGNGKVTGGMLTAGPSNVTLTLNLGGTPAVLSMVNAKIVGKVAATTSAPGDLPPGMKVDPTLKVFDSISASTDGSQGLCGDITVASLAQIPIPQALTTGVGNCTQGYTYCGTGMPVGANCNSLLDVLVGGCNVVGGFIVAINPKQPDVPGNGTKVIPLMAAGAKKKVTVPAGDNDAYSSYLTFSTERMHFTGESCTASSQCQTGQTCTANVCKPQ